MRHLIEQFALSGPILGLILAPVVFGLVQALKMGFAIIDRSPAVVKQLVSVAVALLLFGLAHFIPGFHSPDQCQTVEGLTDACKEALASKDFLMPIISAILANLIHIGRKTANS